MHNFKNGHGSERSNNKCDDISDSSANRIFSQATHISEATSVLDQSHGCQKRLTRDQLLHGLTVWIAPRDSTILSRDQSTHHNRSQAQRDAASIPDITIAPDTVEFQGAASVESFFIAVTRFSSDSRILVSTTNGGYSRRVVAIISPENLHQETHSSRVHVGVATLKQRLFSRIDGDPTTLQPFAPLRENVGSINTVLWTRRTSDSATAKYLQSKRIANQSDRDWSKKWRKGQVRSS